MAAQEMEISSSTETRGLSRYLAHFKWEQMAAGLTSGAATTAILHPLELAKIRLQVNEGYGAVKTRWVLPISPRCAIAVRSIAYFLLFIGPWALISLELCVKSTEWRAFSVSIRALHLTYWVTRPLGDFISYCNYRSVVLWIFLFIALLFASLLSSVMVRWRTMLKVAMNLRSWDQVNTLAWLVFLVSDICSPVFAFV